MHSRQRYSSTPCEVPSNSTFSDAHRSQTTLRCVGGLSSARRPARDLFRRLGVIRRADLRRSDFSGGPTTGVIGTFNAEHKSRETVTY